MEYLDEHERYEHGGLGRDCDAALAVAALQMTVEVEPEQAA